MGPPKAGKDFETPALRGLSWTRTHRNITTGSTNPACTNLNKPRNALNYPDPSTRLTSDSADCPLAAGCSGSTQQQLLELERPTTASSSKLSKCPRLSHTRPQAGLYCDLRHNKHCLVANGALSSSHKKNKGTGQAANKVHLKGRTAKLPSFARAFNPWSAKCGACWCGLDVVSQGGETESSA